MSGSVCTRPSAINASEASHAPVGHTDPRISRSRIQDMIPQPHPGALRAVERYPHRLRQRRRPGRETRRKHPDVSRQRHQVLGVRPVQAKAQLLHVAAEVGPPVHTGGADATGDEVVGHDGLPDEVGVLRWSLHHLAAPQDR